MPYSQYLRLAVCRVEGFKDLGIKPFRVYGFNVGYGLTTPPPAVKVKPPEHVHGIKVFPPPQYAGMGLLSIVVSR